MVQSLLLNINSSSSLMHMKPHSYTVHADMARQRIQQYSWSNVQDVYHAYDADCQSDVDD